MHPVARDRVRVGGILLAAVVLVATSWFVVVERIPLLDALYHTVITVSTVGFKEVDALDDSGRVFTMFVIVVGVGAALYTLSGFFEQTVEGQIDRLGRRRMERKIGRLEKHVIVCGYGRVGRKVAEILGAGHDVLVVERDEEVALGARDSGHTVLAGDATEDDVLNRAGLDRAAALVSALPTDADNLYIVLTARDLNQDVTIVSRVQGPAGEAKLRRAGADRVVNPEDIGARRLATSALNPAVSEFFDIITGREEQIEYRVEEMVVEADSRLAGETVGTSGIREDTGALVLALRRRDGSFQANPTQEDRIDAGSTLIVVGTAEQLRALTAITSNA